VKIGQVIAYFDGQTYLTLNLYASKDISSVNRNSISNKCCSFELSIHQSILKKKNPQKS